MTTALLSETLTEIKRTIETYGWLQRICGDRLKGFCLDGAIGDVCFGVERDTNDHLPNYSAARQLLHGIVGQMGETLNITDWNDVPTRTRQDVLNLLDRAIGAAREREMTPVG